MLTQPPHPERLVRVRAGARATLALGIGASLAANVLAAQPTVIGRVIAAWPPVALLLTVELLSRLPVAPGWLSRLRVISAAGIAGIAAWVSYWHMAAVALEYGEAPVAAHLLPLSVDGLVVVASVCLVELARPATEQEAEPAGAACGGFDQSTAARPTGRPQRRKPSNGRAPVGSKQDQVRRLAGEHPDWSQAHIAQAAGCSVRTVRRHLATQPATDPSPMPTEPAALPALAASTTNGHNAPETQE